MPYLSRRNCGRVVSISVKGCGNSISECTLVTIWLWLCIHQVSLFHSMHACIIIIMYAWTGRVLGGGEGRLPFQKVQLPPKTNYHTRRMLYETSQNSQIECACICTYRSTLQIEHWLALYNYSFKLWLCYACQPWTCSADNPIQKCQGCNNLVVPLPTLLAHGNNPV